MVVVFALWLGIFGVCFGWMILAEKTDNHKKFPLDKGGPMWYNISMNERRISWQ
jgi:hypothetical protein